MLKACDRRDLTPDDWIEARSAIGLAMAEFDECLAEVDADMGFSSASSRMLRLLQIRFGQIVTKDELGGVAGIHAWARRVRELRQDAGWDIETATTSADLSPGDYRLRSHEPDLDLAANWTAARQMAKLKTTGGTATPKARVLEYLREIYPRAAGAEQVAYVAGSSENASTALASLKSEGWHLEHEDNRGDAEARVSLRTLDQ